MLWDSILRRAADLSMFSDTDVGLMMFSPTGQFTSFASKGRIEDIFLRFLDWCDERGQPLKNHEVAYRSSFSHFPHFLRLFLSPYYAVCCLCLQFLRKSLKHLKYEAEILAKIGRIEELERKLADLNRKKYEAEEKMRSYNPETIQKRSIYEATHRQQIVMDAIRRIEKLKHEKLLEKEISPSNPNNVEMPSLEVGSSSAAAEVTNSETQRNQLPNDHNEKNIKEMEPSTS
ncbi:agamous-like MADS-box protein AGL66 isoform X2 [Hibiscus syriacus]|uniref:agamous-like MADS-box protein AGL66 isoform X2 n=1 Tax=Hibiscus syriacus TaxID=106335 RepID=UPI001924FD38|nr:agamous-like MADS-box protein AGL66 isoform X2 [Hibiscus syriacus]